MCATCDRVREAYRSKGGVKPTAPGAADFHEACLAIAVMDGWFAGLAEGGRGWRDVGVDELQVARAHAAEILRRIDATIAARSDT